jgi:hypothetical protein
MGLSMYDEAIPLIYAFNWLSYMGTNEQAITGMLARAARIDSVHILNSDTIDHDVELRINAGSAPFPLGTVNVPAGAGHGTVPIVKAELALAPGAQNGWVLAVGQSFSSRLVVAVGATASVTVWLFGGYV